MDEVVENLRACLLSSKGGISLNRINKDYFDVVGERIPYRRFNFQNLEEFLSCVPGIHRVLRGSEYFFEAVASDKTQHLAELVRRQKPEKKKTRKVTSYNPPMRTPYGSNQNYQRNQSGIRSQSAYTKAPYITNTRMGSTKGPPKTSPTSNYSFRYPPSTKNDVPPKTSPTSNSSFRYPPSAKTNYVPLSNQSSAVKRQSSSVQSRLKITPKTTDTESNETLRREPQPVLSSPILTTSNCQRREPDARFNSGTVASMIPFDQFVPNTTQLTPMTPQKELENLAARLNMSSPEYKILPPIRGNNYAQVSVGNKKYSSYPEDAKDNATAQTIAATKAVEDLKEKTGSTSLPVTQDATLIKKRMLSIIDEHPSGVFTSQFIILYKQKHQEVLPDDWMKILYESQEVQVEQGANQTSILTRFIPTQEKVEEVPALSPFGKMSLNPHVLHSPGKLELPKEKYWITHVTVVYGTDDIFVQLVGEEYSDQFDDLTIKMKEFYTKNLASSKARSIEEDNYYAICIDQNWYRVKCLEFDPRTGRAAVHFIDHGDDEICLDSMLHNLDKQFCNLPAQAVRLSLHGLEEFADCKGAELIVEKYLLERTLYIEVQKINTEEELTSVIFYDTDGPNDINMNNLMSMDIVKFCMPKPQLKAEGRITEVYVSHVSQTGEVYLQLKNDNMRHLVNLMNKLIHEKLSQDLSKLAVTKVNLTKVYLVQSPEDKNWYRAQVRNVNYTTNQVDVFLMDFGKTVTIKMGPSLIDLESLSETLTLFPAQALQVQLLNVPTFLDAEKIDRLTKLAPVDQSLIVKVVQKTDNGSLPVVELFKRQQPTNEIISINNTLVFDLELKPTNDDNNNVKMRKRSDRLTSRYGSSADKSDPHQRTLRQPKIPAVNELFDVHVTLVSNPGNFVVQPLKDQTNLNKMHEKMQEECKKSTEAPPAFESVKEGNLYAAQHSDGDWYRVCVLNKFMDQLMVTIYLCDYGEATIVPVNKLQALPAEFFELPYQAIRANLAGVKPVNVDWSVEDCLKFKDLIEEKNMASVVKALFISDQSGETIISLKLIDVSGPDDINIDEVLLKEGRAQLP